MRRLLPFLVVLITVAFFTKIDQFFYLLYILFGIYVLGRLWARRSLAAVSVHRQHEERIFLGQSLEVEVEVVNRSWLPILWLRLADAAPSELASGPSFRRILSLAPRETRRYTYQLVGRHRGYYRFGAIGVHGGDILGTNTYAYTHDPASFCIVYPRVIPLSHLDLPSQSPFGSLPSKERIFQDPTRILGVRAYQPGDSLRSIDWKTSARVGALQVRRFEPAISLETALFLNLDDDDYPASDWYRAIELGIVIAASLAVHVTEKRQAVSLTSNGRDPFQDDTESVPPVSLPLRKGREHVMNILDVLARIEVARGEQAQPFLDMLNRSSMKLPWGSTVVVITSQEIEGLMDSLVVLRRRGLAVVLVTTCPNRDYAQTASRAAHIGVQPVRIWSEQDLDVWR